MEQLIVDISDNLMDEGIILKLIDKLPNDRKILDKIIEQTKEKMLKIDVNNEFRIKILEITEKEDINIEEKTFDDLVIGGEYITRYYDSDSQYAILIKVIEIDRGMEKFIYASLSSEYLDLKFKSFFRKCQCCIGENIAINYIKWKDRIYFELKNEKI